MGIVGAAAATSVSYSSLLLLYSGFTVSKLNIWPYNINIWLKVALSGLVTTAVIASFEGVIQSDLVSLFIIPPIGLVIYSVILLRLNAMNIKRIYNLWDSMPISNIAIFDNMFYKVKPLLVKIGGKND
jgi:hypothetical protein